MNHDPAGGALSRGFQPCGDETDLGREIACFPGTVCNPDEFAGKFPPDDFVAYVLGVAPIGPIHGVKDNFVFLNGQQIVEYAQKVHENLTFSLYTILHALLHVQLFMNSKGDSFC